MPLGPVELLAIKFPKDHVSGQVAAALQDLIAKGTIRVIDLLVASKDSAGNITIRELNDLDEEDYAALDPIASEIDGLLSREDVERLSSLMVNDSTTALMLFEDTWATRFRDAVESESGQLLYSERIPRAVVDEVIALGQQPGA